MSEIVEKFANRLNTALTIRNMKPVELHEKTGISESLISKYLSNNAVARLDKLSIIANALNVNPVWLMGYDVPMEREIDKNIQGIDKKSDSSALVFVYGTIPAGVPMECIEDIIDTEEISADMLKCGKQYFGLKVKGNSMFPEYLDGDTLILEKVEDVENGQDAIIMVNGNDGTFKRVFKNENGIILQPLNNSYQPMVYTNEQIETLPIRIIGKVVELRRKK